jgi:hypothetical protein
MRRERREIDSGCSAADDVCDGVRGSGSEQNAIAMMACRKELRSFSAGSNRSFLYAGLAGPRRLRSG